MPLAPDHRLPLPLPALARERYFRKGAYVYRPADRMESVFILRSGAVKIGGYDPEGREVVYDTAGPGDFFGNLKYLGNSDGFQEFVRTLTPVTVQVFDLRQFKELLTTYSRVHEWFARLMVRRWARTEARLFRISAHSPAERLRLVLAEIGGGTEDLRGLLTQSDLAGLTGLTRQTVARLLRQM